MDFLTGSPGPLYRRYLTASVGSALVVSIYSFVDTLAVGQSVGPLGSAAIAAINPIFGMMTFLAILCGIGGSVLMTNAKARGRTEQGDAYFTASLLLAAIVTAVCWAALFIWNEPILRFFGATDETLPYVKDYAIWIIRFFPLFILPNFLSAFIRNDGAPGLAMGAVISGGLLNVFGDWFLCFPMDMGMSGAAIATVSGTALQCVIMSSHFFSKRCHLRIVKPYVLGKALGKILSLGFGSSVLDLGTVVLNVLINAQINRYGTLEALSVYGVVSTISCLFQAIFCGVGQAIQPLVSANHGAKAPERVRAFLRYGLLTSAVMGLCFTLIGELLPRQITALFVAATPEVLDAAPQVVRLYFPMFLFLGINITATYYLQSVRRGRASLIVSILRSIVLSGALLLLLPAVLPAERALSGVLLSLPVSELITMCAAMVLLKSAVRRDRINIS